MWNFLIDTMSIAYVQLAILILFIWYFLVHRKDPRMPVSRVGLIRLVIMVVIFTYFLLSWASGIRPALAQAAVFGMFVINLIFLFSLVRSRLERPYRDALNIYCQDPQNREHLDDVWSSGKRFYYLRHFFNSIMSGESPTQFLHEVTIGRIRDDVQACLRQRGLTQQFISLKGMIAFLESRLGEEALLPPEFKEVVKKDLQDFQKHPWVEEQINEYLRMALETPEDIHNPDWSRLLSEKANAPK
ncbi:MAG: hypothetical protein C4567_01315 [Deltaproteobacteria bacterium]|nr:MAG: hypothetical protein C4567_01315 [Deltaproteobacteria bacterium]